VPPTLQVCVSYNEPGAFLNAKWNVVSSMTSEYTVIRHYSEQYPHTNIVYTFSASVYDYTSCKHELPYLKFRLLVHIIDTINACV